MLVFFKRFFSIKEIKLAIEGNQPRQAECVVFANHKGGTGKTTSCISTAGYLAKNCNMVLVVDFDPNAIATSGLGIGRQEAIQEITEYIEVFYNRQRRQARLGFLSPVAYEQKFYAARLAA